MTYCHCGDYCEWCRPDLCESLSPSEAEAIHRAIRREEAAEAAAERGE